MESDKRKRIISLAKILVARAEKRYPNRPDWAELEASPEFYAEMAISDAQELIAGLLRKQKMSKADLGRRIGKERNYISNFLSSGRNLRILSLGRLCFALGHEIRMRGVPLRDEEGEEVVAKYPREVYFENLDGVAREEAYAGIAILEAQYLLRALLAKGKMPAEGLSRRMGMRSRAYISGLLTTGRNLSINIFGRVVFALEHELKFKAVPISQGEGGKDAGNDGK